MNVNDNDNDNNYYIDPNLYYILYKIIFVIDDYHKSY